MVQTDNGNGGRSSLHGFWSSRLAFILAVTGSAVGLGNIWKFPYIAGQNGGGAFVLVYLLCVFGVGLPIMMSEVLLGRRGRRNPVASMALLGEEEGGTRSWSLIGLSGVVAGFLILSFYSVIAGWVFAYIFKSGAGDFAGADAEQVKTLVQSLEGSWLATGAWHTLFMGLTVFVVARGVERGLEVAVTLMVPALIVILVLLLGYSMTSGEFEMGVRFLFEPDFSKLSAGSVLAAMRHGLRRLSATGDFHTRNRFLGCLCRHRDRIVERPGYISHRICEWPRSDGGSRAYFPGAAPVIWQHAFRDLFWHIIFYAGRLRRADLRD